MPELTLAVRNVLLGATLLGVAGGALGCFALLRRQSLLGDAVAHAALPGVCLAYLFTHSKEPLVLFAGALVAGLVGCLGVLGVVRASRVKEDAAIGMVLSVFFGLGIVLLTHIQKLPFANQSGLDRFLFGQAATLMQRDLVMMAAFGGTALLLAALFFKELKLLCFDRDFAASLGLPTRLLEILLTVMLVAVVVVALQAVGVVLIVATLITPAAAARQWTERLGTMVILAALIGGTSGAAGALLSATVARLPTGPVIVICSSAVLVVSILFAPRRGLSWAWLAERAVRRRIRQENLLRDLYRWTEGRTAERQAPVPLSVLMGLRGQTVLQLERVARRLRSHGLLLGNGSGWLLTRRGFEIAEQVVRKHRLWETYISRRLDLPPDHLHRDADTMEHALSDQAVDTIDELLGRPSADPHGRPIPRRRAS